MPRRAKARTSGGTDGRSSTSTTTTTTDLCHHVASLCPASVAQTEELLGCSSPAQLRSVAAALTSPDGDTLATALAARAAAMDTVAAALRVPQSFRAVVGFIARDTALYVSRAWRQMRDLTTLRLMPRDVRDAAVQALASSCPNLTTIHLSSCTNITDAAVQALASSCPRLTEAYLNGCPNITDAAVRALRAARAGIFIKFLVLSRE